MAGSLNASVLRKAGGVGLRPGSATSPSSPETPGAYLPAFRGTESALREGLIRPQHFIQRDDSSIKISIFPFILVSDTLAQWTRNNHRNALNGVAFGAASSALGLASVWQLLRDEVQREETRAEHG